MRPPLIVAHPPIFSRPSIPPPNYAVHSETVRLQAAPLQLHRLRIAVRGSGILATDHYPKDSRELDSGNLLILFPSFLPDCHTILLADREGGAVRPQRGRPLRGARLHGVPLIPLLLVMTRFSFVRISKRKPAQVQMARRPLRGDRPQDGPVQDRHRPGSQRAHHPRDLLHRYVAAQRPRLLLVPLLLLFSAPFP